MLGDIAERNADCPACIGHDAAAYTAATSIHREKKMNWYIKCLKQYVDFSGRASRMEFWMFALFNFLISLVLAIVDFTLGLGFLQPLYALAVLLPALAVSVRRLHDTGRAGWWLLLILIPLIGPIILIVFWVQDSNPGDNAFGPNPKAVMA